VGSAVMMLTSADQLGDGARCRELGISAHLVKPIRQSELLDTIRQALKKEIRTESAPAPRIENPPPPERRRVLVAEDNRVNQVLTVGLLEKKGYSVCITGNGRDALAALARESFDIVLMDVQMPEMDGFEATTQIRAGEQITGRHVPIVAMTAYALKGDCERCLSAGMDGYISKPIRSDELFALMDRLLEESKVPTVQV